MWTMLIIVHSQIKGTEIFRQASHGLVGAHVPNRAAEKNPGAEQEGAGHHRERHPQSRTTRPDRAAQNRVEILSVLLRECPFLIILILRFWTCSFEFT